jgi:hypothetical protein
MGFVPHSECSCLFNAPPGRVIGEAITYPSTCDFFEGLWYTDASFLRQKTTFELAFHPRRVLKVSPGEIVALHGRDRVICPKERSHFGIDLSGLRVSFCAVNLG